MPGAAADPRLLACERAMVGDLYTSWGARDALEVLCDDCGSRWGGTDGERRAAEYLETCLRGCGLAAVRREPFDYVAWERRPATLRLVEPVEREIPCISLPGVVAQSAAGPMVDLGDCHPDRIPGELGGALVLVDAQPPVGLEWTVHRTEKYQRCFLAGAGAFLYAGQYPGLGPETGSLSFDRSAPIPGVSVSFEDAAFLRRLHRRHGRLVLRLETRDRQCPAVSWNVYGELPGGGSGRVLLGCHYDGHDIAQGAQDPASGTAALLECARVLATHARGLTGCTIGFLFFGIEETGLTGATRYVEQHAAEMDEIRFLLNLDSAGMPGRKGLKVNGWPELEPHLERWAEEMAAEVPVGQRTSAYSDHYPFLKAGVPTAMMGDPDAANTGRGYGHSAYDTVDKVALADMREAAAVAARLALRMSRLDPWPLRRRTPDEVAAFLATDPGLRAQASVRTAYLERLALVGKG